LKNTLPELENGFAQRLPACRQVGIPQKEDFYLGGAALTRPVATPSNGRGEELGHCH
jgi:hypothetical protein